MERWSVQLDERLLEYLEQKGITEPTGPQLDASPLISMGKNVLIIAPTGSGKTEAAVLPVLNNLIKKRESGILVLYVTPLRALNRDMLSRLELMCRKVGLRVEVRHGDTPARERRKQSRSPPELLITTPETLQAILPGRKMRENLSSLSSVIVDELHSIIESKRGTQLAVAVERLRKIKRNFQLVALSATIGSPERASSFLFGSNEAEIVRSRDTKSYDFSVIYPLPGNEKSEGYYSSPELNARLGEISRQIEMHKSVLIFTNSRTIAEMLGEKLSRIRNDVAVHHGSLPGEERERVESSFKKGEIKAIVCTSTLELGIDIGSVDLVINYMSPRSVTSLIQRTGRSGHSLSRTSKGIIICVSADDILESCACIRLARKQFLEETRPYVNSLDVLSHQICGYLLDLGSINAEELLGEIRKANPYASLSRDDFYSTVNYLASNRILKLENNFLKRTAKTSKYYFENISMIPDEIRYIVVDVLTNQSVGILGEEFVLLRARPGVHFVLKGKVWKVEKVTDDRKVFVTPVDDPLAAIPGWEGELVPVDIKLAMEKGKLREELYELIINGRQEEAEKMLLGLGCDANSVSSVINELVEQIKIKAPVPTHRQIVLEGFDKYLIIHSCFGERVNRAFGFSFEEIMSREGLVRLWWADGYRILFELTSSTEEIDLDELARKLFFIGSNELEDYFRVAVKRNFPFPERIKNVAMRFGALKRGMYISHPNLCSLPTRFEYTPVYNEGLNEVMHDLIDIENAKNVLEKVRKSEVRVSTYKSGSRPSPIAYHILFKHVEVPEAIAPESLSETIISRMRTTIELSYVSMVCMSCARVMERVQVYRLDEHPRCSNCGSQLLYPCFYETQRVRELLEKMRNEEITKEERKEVSYARRCADLVLSYGKKAVYALSVYGIGPQTASRILSEMHRDDESFYKALIDAKIKFIKTRAYWKD